MIRTAHRWWLGLLLAVPAGAAGQDNPLTKMGGLVLSAWAGGAANSDLQRSQASARWRSADGDFESRRFDRRLGAETSMAFSLGLAYWFNEHWGVRAQTGLSPSHLEISVSRREITGIPADTSLVGPARFDDLLVWTADAQVLFRLPLTPRGRVAPYGFAGTGRIEYRAIGERSLPPEAVHSFRTENPKAQLAGVVGLGALVPLQRKNLTLGFELSAHVSGTPVPQPPLMESSLDDVVVLTGAGQANAVDLTTHVRLLIGINWFAR